MMENEDEASHDGEDDEEEAEKLPEDVTVEGEFDVLVEEDEEIDLTYLEENEDDTSDDESPAPTSSNEIRYLQFRTACC